MRITIMLILTVVMLFSLSACGNANNVPETGDEEYDNTVPDAVQPDDQQPDEDHADSDDGLLPQDKDTEKNGSVVILFTSDVHCAVNEGFGFDGLAQIRSSFEEKGFETILVDNGDAVQGDVLGTLTEGEAIIKLMNDLEYDVAIPGNHEFDYGMDQFMKLTDMAEFPYISCNFNHLGEKIFPSYLIIETAGIKIGFVGVTTPKTIVTSTPDIFRDDSGEFVYGFLEDENGDALYNAVQQAVDSARADGADYVYVLGHLGLLENHSPWTYAEVISNTAGYEVFLDGHSHDTEQVVMKNREGNDVVRSACGTKLGSIGYSIITPEGISDTGIWNWSNKVSSGELFGFNNNLTDNIKEALEDLDKTIKTVVARTDFELTISDPVEKDSKGNPVRMVRRAETNLGDLSADAFRAASGADIVLLNGGAVRKSILPGEITYGDIIGVMPFGNEMCMIEATGQQIIDALEWGARSIPGENGGFLQVSGLTYEIDVSIESSCITGEAGMFSGVAGEYRVRNVMTDNGPIDPDRLYTVASTDYVLLNNGDGHTAFDGAKVISEGLMIDNKVLIDYLTDILGGTVGDEYADPYGHGRIIITGGN